MPEKSSEAWTYWTSRIERVQMRHEARCTRTTQIVTEVPNVLRDIRIRLLPSICLLAFLGGLLGCQRDQRGPLRELARIGGTAYHDDDNPLGPGYAIDLNGPLVTDRDIEYAHLWPAQEIVTLDLSGTRITDAGLGQLNAFTNLRELKLRSTNISDEGLRYLATLEELRSLDLGNTQVMGPGLEYLQSLPHLERLELDETKLTDNGLKYVRGLRQIRSLNIRNTAVSDRGLKHITELSGLRSLSVGPMVTNAGLEQLGKLLELTKLSLEGTSSTDSGVRELRRALPGLKVHDSRFRKQRPLFAPDLTQQQAIEKIEEMGGSVTVGEGISGKSMVSVYLYARGADDAMLALLDPFDQIQELHLAGGWISDSGLQHLPPLRQLRSLSLRGDTWRHNERQRRSWPFGTVYRPEVRDTWISDDGVRLLGEHTQLRSLDLTGTYITDDALRSLAQLLELRELGLRNAVVTDAGLKHLRPFKNLRALDLTHTTVSDKGIEHLQALPHLQKLWLGRTLVTDAGMKRLAELENLLFLDVSHTAITDSGLRELSTMKNLREIDLDYAIVTDTGIAELRRALPMTKITAGSIGDRAPRATDAELEERFQPFP